MTPLEILDLVETILVYKFPRLSREEIRDMLQLPVADLKQTRLYQEVYGEGRQEGRQEGQLEGHQRQVRLILRQLQRCLGPVTGSARERVATFAHDDLEALGEALLDFTSAALAAWLAAHGLAAPPARAS